MAEDAVIRKTLSDFESGFGKLLTKLFVHVSDIAKPKGASEKMTIWGEQLCWVLVSRLHMHKYTIANFSLLPLGFHLLSFAVACLFLSSLQVLCFSAQCLAHKKKLTYNDRHVCVSARHC